MSENDPNLVALKEAYHLWHDTKGQSVDHWLDLMTDDVKFRSLAEGTRSMEFTRLSSCKQDVRSYFAGLTANWEMIHYRIDEYIVQGDRIVALGHCSFRNKRTGKLLETPKADFHRFRDGKICKFFELYDMAQTIAAATAP
ncbi:MAG TPA: nuclear transport factor 2 family protein [Terriglobales bacterium]|jgi:ketosteroid isomerase-like protein|nr:nuclear transport factor 2 family protein [Terriglobales bacterium]